MPHVSKNWATTTIADVNAAPAAGEPGLRLVVPQDCSRIVIENQDAANDAYLQSDPTDASSQKKIPKGLELDINAKSSGDPVFVKGEIVGYLLTKAGAATGPIVLTFTR